MCLFLFSGHKWYKTTVTRDHLCDFPRPHLTIYIDATVDETLVNIKRRNRVSKDFKICLQRQHTGVTLLAQWVMSSLLLTQIFVLNESKIGVNTAGLQYTVIEEIILLYKNEPRTCYIQTLLVGIVRKNQYCGQMYIYVNYTVLLILSYLIFAVMGNCFIILAVFLGTRS